MEIDISTFREHIESAYREGYADGSLGLPPEQCNPDAFWFESHAFASLVRSIIEQTGGAAGEAIRD